MTIVVNKAKKGDIVVLMTKHSAHYIDDSGAMYRKPYDRLRIVEVVKADKKGLMKHYRVNGDDTLYEASGWGTQVFTIGDPDRQKAIKKLFETTNPQTSWPSVESLRSDIIKHMEDAQ